MRKLAVMLATLAALSTGGSALAQSAEQALPKPAVSFTTQAASIPFELFRGNRIIVPAILNGHQTSVLLDTGASVTTIDRAYARAIGLPEGRKSTATGAGGTVEAEIVPNVSLEIGGMRFDNMTVAVIDLALVSRGIGRPANVILGREFFDSAVVSIDWSASRLHISSPSAFTPKPGAVELRLARLGPFNTIPVSIAGGTQIRALLDLGNGANLVLPRTYWGNRPELAQLRYAESRMGGVGGLHPARSATVPKVIFAGQTFTDVPAILSETGNDHDPEKMANVGIGMLKQFQVDLDLGRDRIYLTPRPDPAAFDRDRSGTRLELVGDRLRVAFLSPQGPAAKAGLRQGDQIVAVDGKRITADYYQGADWTRGPAGKPVEITRDDGSRIKVVLADYY